MSVGRVVLVIRFEKQLNGDCGLCGTTLEDRDHLFLDCSFSRNVWSSVLQLCGWHMDVFNWVTELRLAIDMLKGGSLLTVILQLAYNSFIYFIWKEMSVWIFQSRHSSPQDIVQNIKESVKWRLMEKPLYRNSFVATSLCINWGLD
ncbi:hypothetical protein GQ457_18G021270 [Hibiscus cannabinus]